MAVNEEKSVDKAADKPADKAQNSPLNIQREGAGGKTDAKLDKDESVAPWDRDDAPAGSTSESLLTKDKNGEPRVSSGTHYTTLADGRIVPGFGIGTHYDDGDSVVPVVAHFAG